jgi:hypothetical protein
MGGMLRTMTGTEWTTVTSMALNLSREAVNAIDFVREHACDVNEVRVT